MEIGRDSGSGEAMGAGGEGKERWRVGEGAPVGRQRGGDGARSGRPRGSGRDV
jgi:hypothetical protein